MTLYRAVKRTLPVAAGPYGAATASFEGGQPQRGGAIKERSTCCRIPMRPEVGDMRLFAAGFKVDRAAPCRVNSTSTPRLRLHLHLRAALCRHLPVPNSSKVTPQVRESCMKQRTWT